jgi:hypothetical protein
MQANFLPVDVTGNKKIGNLERKIEPFLRETGLKDIFKHN